MRILFKKTRGVKALDVKHDEIKQTPNTHTSSEGNII